MDAHDEAAETVQRRIAAGVASFYACAAELMAWFDQEQLEGLSALERPNGVRISLCVWEAVRRDIGAERFTELIKYDWPALIELARERYRGALVDKEWGRT